MVVTLDKLGIASSVTFLEVAKAQSIVHSDGPST
jgi:hypothetical protein